VKIGGANSSITEQGMIAAAKVELRTNGGNIYVLAGNKGGSNNAIGVTKSGGHIFLTAPGGRVIVRKQVRARRRIFRNSRPRIDGGDIFVNANIVNI